MEARKLAQYALLCLKQVQQFTPIEKAQIIYVATHLINVEIQEAARLAAEAKLPRDELYEDER
jgi:hypothetical protein